MKGLNSEPKEVRYYEEYTDDFVDSGKSEGVIPKSYKWYHTNKTYRFFSWIAYSLAFIFGFFHSRLALHTKVVGREAFKKCKDTGFVLYGNHTQTLGDVFSPTQYVFPKRIFSVAGVDNLELPVIGKIIPIIGGIVVPDSMEHMKLFLDAIKRHLEDGRVIVVYPEAHLWQNCTFVRPFPITSFRFPVMFDAPAYCMTTTYQKRRFGKKPKTTVYIDGPFYPDKNLKTKEAQRKLCDEIHQTMVKRSKNSNYEYIRYVKKGSE